MSDARAEALTEREATERAATTQPALQPGTAGLRVVSSQALQVALYLSAAGTAAVLLLVSPNPGPGGLMFRSGLLAVLAVFIAFEVFSRKVPEAFVRLAARDMLEARRGVTLPAFIRELQGRLDSRAQLGLGIVFAILAFSSFPVRFGGLAETVEVLRRQVEGRAWLLPLDIVAEMVLGFVLGLMAWRMIVVAVGIARLGRQFDLQLQLGHPDGCGGARPLGDVCLWNALILSIPAIHLGLWISLAQNQRLSVYIELYWLFLLLLVGLAIVTFVAPLWGVHQSMLEDARALRLKADHIGQQIDAASVRLLDGAGTLPAEEVDRLAADIERLEKAYARYDKLPTWPIDFPQVLRFSSSQLVPVLSLTGLSQPVIDTIESVVKAVSPS